MLRRVRRTSADRCRSHPATGTSDAGDSRRAGFARRWKRQSRPRRGVPALPVPTGVVAALMRISRSAVPDCRFYDFEECYELASVNKPMNGRFKAARGRATARTTRAGSMSCSRTFPPLSAKPRQPDAELWPQAARDLADSLLRTTKLAALEGGLELNRTSQSFDLRFNELQLAVAAAGARVAQSLAGALRRRHIADARAVVRCPDPRHLFGGVPAWPAASQHAGGPAHRPPWGRAITRSRRSTSGMARYKAEVRPEADGRQRLVLTTPHNAEYQIHYVIDTARNVARGHRKPREGGSHRHNKILRLCRARRHVVGHDQSSRSTSRDAGTSLTTQTIAALTAEQFNQRMAAGIGQPAMPCSSSRSRCRRSVRPRPRRPRARRPSPSNSRSCCTSPAASNGRGSMSIWPPARSWPPTKPGVRWMRLSIYSLSRRHEELRKLLAGRSGAARAAAGRWAVDRQRICDLRARAVPGPRGAGEPRGPGAAAQAAAGLPAAAGVLAGAQGVAAAGGLSGASRPAKARKPSSSTSSLPGTIRATAKLQREYAQRLASRGEYPAAYAWLERRAGRADRLGANTRRIRSAKPTHSSCRTRGATTSW